MKYPVKLEIPVAWGEMDAYGHVNNVVFFRYFESARIEYFRSICKEEVGKGSFVPIVASTECSYLRPVHFPDTLVAEATITKVGTSSFTMEYRLTSSDQNEVVAQGKAVIVNIDQKTGKGVPLSDETKQRISELEGL